MKTKKKDNIFTSIVMPPDIHKRLQRVMEVETRSRQNATLIIIIRGLDAWEKDNKK